MISCKERHGIHLHALSSIVLCNTRTQKLRLGKRDNVSLHWLAGQKRVSSDLARQTNDLKLRAGDM